MCVCHTQDFARIAAHDKIMVKMSVQLRGDTALRIGMHWLSRIWYFDTDVVEKVYISPISRPTRTLDTT